MGVRSSQPRSPHLNKTDGHLIEYYRNVFSAGGGGTKYVAPPVNGLTATGGVISDYIEPGPGNVYRAHVFTTSGEFDVTDTGNQGGTIEYLVVAGGGGGGMRGGGNAGGGGGAGGLRTNLTGHPLSTGSPFTVSSTTYTVTIGAGGQGATNENGTSASNGTDSYFGPPNPPDGITSTGGGYGGGSHDSSTPESYAQPGGSGGGGGGASGYAGGNGNTVAPTSPSQGNSGGGGYNSDPFTGGGGGGAGTQGQSYSLPSEDPLHGSDGGAGIQVAIAGPAADTDGVGALNPGPGQGQWFAGGGGGGSYPAPQAEGAGGVGGGGAGSRGSVNGGLGASSTGGGGGGAGTDANGGFGGSGIVVLRYLIGAPQSGTAKATGGAISYYNGKTIHTFTSSGTFETKSNWSPTNVEYLVIGGGAGGSGWDIGGGGGAGAFLSNTNHPIGTHPVSVNIQVGAGGRGSYSPSYPSPRVEQTAYGTDGTPSYFGTPLTAPGGGRGGSPAPLTPTALKNGAPGGSGGGGGYATSGGPSTGDSYPGTPGTTPTNGWGHAGGSPGGSGSPRYGSGGGGGAGTAGGAGNPEWGGYGGQGVQVPSTFRDPAQQSTNATGGGLGVPGPSSSYFWVAGGGGGATEASTDPGSGNASAPARATLGGIGGGGNGGNNGPRLATSGVNNTGSGGGGVDGGGKGGAGGSGIVLIAYPT